MSFSLNFHTSGQSRASALCFFQDIFRWSKKKKKKPSQCFTMFRLPLLQRKLLSKAGAGVWDLHWGPEVPAWYYSVFPSNVNRSVPDVFTPQGMLSGLTWRLHLRRWNAIYSEWNQSKDLVIFFFFLQLKTLLQLNTEQLKLLKMTVTHIYSFSLSL